MAEKMTAINPLILVWARKASGTSLEDVEAKFGKDKINDWEKGIDYPTYNQLQQLCDYYRKPVAICFFPEPPVLKNLSTSFRTVPANIESSLLNRKIVKLIDEARIMQMNLRELNDNVNLQYSLFSDMDFGKDISSMAKKLREALNVDIRDQKASRTSSEQFEFWRNIVSQVGIYIFKDAFRDENTSGFCLYDPLFPIIYVNNTFSFTRQIFTVFHEICHIMYKTSGIDIMNDSYYLSNLVDSDLMIERNCNSFAGTFLVPDQDFQEQIKSNQVTEDIVARLAVSYGVSREVILRKFLDYGRIGQDEYNHRSAQYTQDYFRVIETKDKKDKQGNYYNTQSAYKGNKYIELVFNKYYSHSITLTQAADFMNMKIPSIRSFAEKKGWGTL